MVVPLVASKFLALVFLNNVCGLHFLVACLFLKACSFWVAGDMISSEGEMTLWGLYMRELGIVQTVLWCQHLLLVVETRMQHFAVIFEALYLGLLLLLLW